VEGVAMSTAESAKTLAGRPWPNGEPATWVYLDDLPTPPEVVREVEEARRRNGWWWRWWYSVEIGSITRELKRRHYFPGKQIVVKWTPRGMLVLMAAEPFAPELESFRAALRAEHQEVQVLFVFGPEDDTTYLLSYLNR
jgi:hypothetical protein